MNKTDFVKKYTHDSEDAVILAQILDKFTAMEQANRVTSTVFLNERQQALAERMLSDLHSISHTFFGGYDDAERRILLFLPDWANADPAQYAPLTCLRAIWSEKTGARVGHRDFLGALMAAGVRRETIGDILPDETSCDLVVLQSVGPFLLQNLTSAGRASLSLSTIPADQLLVPAKSIKRIHDTVASLRLDSIIGAGFGLSREKAAALIRSGHVSVSGLVCEKPDRQLTGGETVSARGFGKFRLTEESGVTKKGRIRIEIEKFL